MLRILLLLTFLSTNFLSFGQAEYSYISDRKFFEPVDLIGYQFVPHGIEVPGKFETDLSPGEYSFGISSNNLYVIGDDIQGVFSINTINTTEYGFKLDLINARNPTMQGHLKVILTNNSQAEAVVFKRSKLESEMVFFLPIMNKNDKAKDKAYFTDYGEILLPHTDSLWGIEMIPFFRIDSEQKMQDRLRAEDSVRITFIEEIEIIEKIKKPKKNKNKAAPKEQKKNVEATEEHNENMEDEEVENAAEMVEAEPIVKTKIIKKYFVRVKSLVNYDDGSSEMKDMKIPIFKVIEREDDTAAPGEERYQISLESDKGRSLYLYMTEDRKVTALEMGSQRYELRY